MLRAQEEAGFMVEGGEVPLFAEMGLPLTWEERAEFLRLNSGGQIDGRLAC